jgi:hypothetical protein
MAFLESLSDIEYQRKYWIGPPFESRETGDTFDMVIHFFLDDAGYLTRSERQIGYSLYNSNEASAVYELCVMLNDLIDTLGPKGPDSDYINSPEWPNIVSQAKLVLTILAQSHH